MSNISAISIQYPTFLELRLYLFTLIFVTGNVALPVAFHQFGIAGQVFLPLYFFSLLAGSIYGWRCGLLVGLLSPLLSFWLTGFPALPILQFVIVKSILLGGISGLIKERSNLHHPLLIATGAVVITQLFGILYILTLTNNVNLALMDLTIGYPGLSLQLLAVPLISKWLQK